MTYGVPYRGSKNKLAQDIIGVLPSGKRFVDLFAGGCAMTHAAILSQKYEKFLCNDKFPIRGQDVFRQACAGEFNKPEYQRFIGHDEFFERRWKEGWIMAVWGWGNDTRYLGKNYERLSKDIGADDVYKLADKNICNDPKKRLIRLIGLNGTDLSKVDFTQIDYIDYQYEDGDVVYCDPPYYGVGGYRGTENFNNELFWNWVRTRNFPVYVSEYNAPDDFASVWNKRRGGVQNSNGFAKNTTHIEHLFIHNRWRKEE